MIELRFTPIFIARFWSRVDVGGPNDCWPWRAGGHERGYGTISLNGKAVRAPRIAWEFFNGAPMTSDLCACHRCDNPKCCNPEHIFPGTHAENMADLRTKREARRILNAPLDL